MLGGAAVAVVAGIVGIEVSFHAHSAAGATVALALCAAAALGSALRPWPGAARRARVARIAAPSATIARAMSCGWVRPGPRPRRCAG